MVPTVAPGSAAIDDGDDHAATIMRLRCAAEAYRRLVALPVFKTGEVEHLGLAGSIPVRLRQHWPDRPGSVSR